MTGPDQEFKPFSVVTVGTVADNRRGFIRPFYKLRPGVLSLRVLFVCFFGTARTSAGKQRSPPKIKGKKDPPHPPASKLIIWGSREKSHESNTRKGARDASRL